MQIKLYKRLFYVLSVLSLLSIIMVNVFWDITEKSIFLDIASDIILVVLSLVFGYVGYRINKTKE